MAKNLYLKLIFAILLAFTVNSFMYFGFVNSYSSKIFSGASFQEQFHSGIYQYRILSGYFLLWINDFLSTFDFDYELFKLKFLNSNSEPKMYLSFYILNTFFIILSAMMLVFISESKQFIATNSEKLLLISVAIFSIAFSQFVIVPYDVSSYFFLLVFFYFLLQYLEKKSNVHLIILSVVILISTFNRESSALSLSLAATLLYAKFGLKKESILPILVLGLVFLGVYFGIRLTSENFTTNDGNLFLKNFTEPKNIMGILFWLVFFVFTLLLAKDKAAIKNILLFHVFSIPYIILCLYSGILYEIRLYIPIFLTSLMLSRITISKIA